jgi:hypothetical protein
MEGILDLYQKPYDPRRPQVCFDEKSKQLLAPTRPTLPARPGQPQRRDYKRVGTANIFLRVEPKAGRRPLRVTQRRTKADFARCLQELVDELYPQAEQIEVILDNLNTHTPQALYETLGQAEAERLLQKLELHHTPVHGSWLNLAEIEMSVMADQCLDRWIADIPALEQELAAWEAERNRQRSGIRWLFTKEKAREKFARFYSSQSGC